MTTYAVLLPAVNLGPRNKLSMAGWRVALTAHGYAGVRTHALSGNAVVRTKRSERAVVGDVGDALRTEFGLDVAVLVRSRTELAEAVRVGQAFVDATPAGFGVVASFLSALPDAERVARVDPADYLPEEFVVHERTAFQRYPLPGVGLRVGHALWERELDVRATSRTWGTVLAVHRLASAATPAQR